jgi:hypothetical protein
MREDRGTQRAFTLVDERYLAKQSSIVKQVRIKEIQHSTNPFQVSKQSFQLGFVPQLSSTSLSIDLVSTVRMLSHDHHARDNV